MRRAVGRVSAFVCALAFVVASMAPVSAQSSDSVTVTGEIVAVPLSISIPTTTVTFGQMDYLASPQGGSPSAVGFIATGNNGALWTSQTPISITVVSPAVWASSVCVANSSGLGAHMFRLLAAVPADVTAANAAFIAGSAQISTSCATPSLWISNQSAGTPAPFTRYLGAWVQSSDPAATVNATITFSVST